MQKPLKKLPKFKSEDAERKFWSKADSTRFVSYQKTEPGFFPKLKPTVRLISIRLPESLLGQVQVLANKKAMPYQSLIKHFIAEQVRKEIKKDE